MRYPLYYLLLFSVFLQGQDAARFSDEVSAIQNKYDTIWQASKETIVFTGSSSVRMWKDVDQRFSNLQVINSGFGGSQASDLLAYSKELILQFKPKKVFIYEGDNDIAEGKNAQTIMADIQQIITKIKNQNPSTEIILISAKPSISRWNLKKNYKHLNRKFKKLSRKNTGIYFADVWTPMLKKGKLMTNLFIEDGLHMNAKGYEIWYNTLKPFVN